MPLPAPTKSESKNEFINRCVIDDSIKKEYDSVDQRTAVCHGLWNSDKPKKEINFADVEYKNFSFVVQECKKSDDGNYGYFSGAMATIDQDRGNDVIAPGAFDNSIKQYITDGRNIRLYYNHNTNALPLGIINPNDIKYSDGQWLVKGQLNLDTTLGSSVYSLMKQGALSDMSIGYSAINDEYDASNNTRVINQLHLWEVSVVGEPMNTNANITEVKKIDIKDIQDKITSKKDFERILRDSGSFSKKTATYLASFINDDVFNQSDSVITTKSETAKLLKEAVELLKQYK